MKSWKIINPHRIIVQSSPVQSSPVQSSPKDYPDLDQESETHITSDEPEVSIDDSDLTELEERFHADKRNIENLKIEYNNLYHNCQQKKQEIQDIKNIIFSNDFRNNKEIIYNNIEAETCKTIKEHAAHIGQNIRTNPRMARISLDNLKRDTELLALQLDYTNTIEQLFVIHADYKALKEKCDKAEPGLLRLSEIREKRKQRARHEQEEQQDILKFRDILYQ